MKLENFEAVVVDSITRLVGTIDSIKSETAFTNGSLMASQAATKKIIDAHKSIIRETITYITPDTVNIPAKFEIGPEGEMEVEVNEQNMPTIIAGVEAVTQNNIVEGINNRAKELGL